MDVVKRYLSSNREFTITFINSQIAAQKLLSLHQVNKSDSKYVIDLLNANFAMSANLKNSDEELMLIVNNYGNIKQISSQSFQKFYANANITYDEGSSFLFDTGIFEVYKFLGDKQLFHSQINYDEFNVGEMVTKYYHQSEQVNSAVVLASLVAEEGLVLSSGALFIQLLPQHSEETIEKIERGLAGLTNFSKKLATDSEAQSYLSLFDDEFTLLSEDSIFYDCRCSREKFWDDLQTLGVKQLEEILQEDGQITAVCNYCHQKYIFTEDDFEGNN